VHSVVEPAAAQRDSVETYLDSLTGGEVSSADLESAENALEAQHLTR
jgi:hypothetical protein